MLVEDAELDALEAELGLSTEAPADAEALPPLPPGSIDVSTQRSTREHLPRKTRSSSTGQDGSDALFASSPASRTSLLHEHGRTPTSGSRRTRRLDRSQRTQSSRAVTKSYVRIAPTDYDGLWKLGPGPPRYQASVPDVLAEHVPQSQFAADLELFQTHIRAQHAFLRRARHFKWAYLSLAVTCLVTFIALFIYYKYIHDNDTTVPTWMVVILVVLPLLPLPIAAWLLHRGRQLRTEQKQRLRAIADELNSHTYAVLGAKWYVDLSLFWSSQSRYQLHTKPCLNRQAH